MLRDVGDTIDIGFIFLNVHFSICETAFLTAYAICRFSRSARGEGVEGWLLAGLVAAPIFIGSYSRALPFQAILSGISFALAMRGADILIRGFAAGGGAAASTREGRGVPWRLGAKRA